MPIPQYYVNIKKLKKENNSSKLPKFPNVRNAILVISKHSINKTQQTVSSHKITFNFYDCFIRLSNMSNILIFHENSTYRFRIKR